MPAARSAKCTSPCVSDVCAWVTGPLISTFAPDSCAPVESLTDTSARPVTTCANAGAGSASVSIHAAAAAAILFRRVMSSHPPRVSMHDSPDGPRHPRSRFAAHRLQILFELRVDPKPGFLGGLDRGLRLGEASGLHVDDGEIVVRLPELRV